jgi:phosphohistidine phosphatase
MGKTLYIVRHAKSPQDAGDIKDWERPLMETGIQRANKISNILKKKKILPDKIISSHAFRALNTAVIFAKNLDYPPEKIEISYDIYEKSPGHLIKLIQKQSNELSSLMIFGHNPTFTDLYNSLVNEQEIELSTSAAACIYFDLNNWQKIEKKQGKTLFLETGK